MTRRTQRGTLSGTEEVIMVKKLAMVAARSRLTRLPEELTRKGHMDTLVVTRKGENVLAVMPWDLYDGLVETLEILSDPELLANLHAALSDAKSGRTYSHQEVGKELGI